MFIMKIGKVMKIISNQYEVLCDQKRYPCVAMGKLRKCASPLVGDKVQIEQFQDRYGIQKIFPRINELKRPSVANVDQAVIVMSCKDPNFSTTLIDRLIFQITYANIEPIIMVTKMDLLDDNSDVHQAIAEYKHSGYRIFTSDVKTVSPDFLQVLGNKITVLTGQSGAGKSSLLNRLDPSFHLQTQEISKALGRGKHTTRHCELHCIANGYVADTPGFSSMDFSHMHILELADRILDFQPFIGKCQFRDCKHINEPNCAIRQAVNEGKVCAYRYHHYEEVVRMIEQVKPRYERGS